MKKRRPKIVVVGSINMDLVLSCERLPKPGETLAARQCSEVSGGKGANQAVAAARMGGDVTLIGRVGDDVFGPQLIKRLQESNVATEHVQVCQGTSSGIAFVMVESSGQNAIVIVPGANGRLSVDAIRAVAAQIRSADLLILQLEIPIEAIEEACRIAKESKVPVLLNPAPAPAMLPENLYEVDMICPNQTEAERLTGLTVNSSESAKRAAALLLDRGASQVVITLGKEGAFIGRRSEKEYQFELVPSIDVAPIDTTAAGDAFIGALAVYLCEQQELLQACRMACVAGALATTKWGAQTSLPWRAEVEAKARE